MFLPMIVLLVFTFFMTCLVSCNMQASRLRKENIVAEQLTVCKGFVFFSFYFFCTWIVGLIAYLRLGLSIPSFYPLFQVGRQCTLGKRSVHYCEGCCNLWQPETPTEDTSHLD